MQKALGQAHHAHVQAAHEPGLLAGLAHRELGASAADVDEHQSAARQSGELPRAATKGKAALLLPVEDARRQREVAEDAVQKRAAVGRVAQHAGADQQAPRGAVGLEARRVPGQAGTRASDGLGVQPPALVDALAEPHDRRQARVAGHRCRR